MVDGFEIEELAATIIANGDDEKVDQILEGDVVSEFENISEISFEAFSKAVQMLINFTPALNSPLSDSSYHCFGVYDKNIFRAIVKSKMKR